MRFLIENRTPAARASETSAAAANPTGLAESPVCTARTPLPELLSPGAAFEAALLAEGAAAEPELPPEELPLCELPEELLLEDESEPAGVSAAMAASMALAIASTSA